MTINGKLFAISLTQPWASLVALNAKRIETRSWSTRYRGTIAIQAAKGFPDWAKELCLTEPFRKYVPNFKALPLGAIVAVANLVHIVETEYCHEVERGSEEEAFGDYTPGRYAWKLQDIFALPEVIPCRGALSVWEVPTEVMTKINEQIKR
jgi:activating signal cointegrator 1